MGGQKGRTGLIAGRTAAYPYGKRPKRAAGRMVDSSGAKHDMADTPKERFDEDRIIAGEIGPTVVTHAGPGTRGIFL
jgi:fatty acid-binding protein DegV